MTQSVLFDPATVDRRTLPNGLTVIVRVNRSAPVVAIVTYLEVGYFDEPDELAGISHVLEHMFFKGTPSRGPGEIAQETKAAGGYLNAATIYDHTSYYTVLPAHSLEQGLAIQSDALLHSAIDADELRRELEVIVQEARRKLDNPDAVAQETLYELMYERQRMGRWRIGTESFLRSLTRDQLWSFYRRMYRGPRTTLVVAGPVDVEDTHRLIAQYYGELAGGEPVFDRGPAESEQRRFRFREQAGEIVQSHLELGWHTQPAVHDATPALDLLGVVLGQGRASRLYRNVREAGLVHSITARNYTPTKLGLFQVSAELKQEHAALALSAIAGTIRGLAEGIDSAEVERAQSIIDARAMRRLESMEGQASHLAEWQALGDWQLGGAYLDRIRMLTAAELQDVARRYLQSEHASVFLYRPSGSDALGWAEDRVEHQLEDAAEASPPAIAVTSVRAPRRARIVRDRTEDGVHLFHTAGGVPVVVKPRRGTPLVSIALAAAGGPSLESPARAGHSALAARTSIKGTQTRSAAQIALDAEALGASVHPGVSADLLDWSITVPKRHFEPALELMLDAAQNPVFPEMEVEKEKQIALADLQQVRDDMYRYPLRLFLSAAFPEHAYGTTLEQTEAAIQSATADDLRTWHRRTVLEAAPQVILVGDVDPERAATAMAQALDLRGHAVPQASDAAWPGRQTEISVTIPKAQTALVLGFPGVSQTQPDYVVLQVLANTIAGLGGRLFEELRSRRSLAYTVTAYPMARARGGAFIGYIATAPDREDEARQGLLAELGRVRDELLPEAEVERARRYTIGSWQIRQQTNAAQLSELLHALLIGRGLAELREYEQRVNAVTPQQIREIAQRYFDETRLVQAVVRGIGGGR